MYLIWVMIQIKLLMTVSFKMQLQASFSSLYFCNIIIVKTGGKGIWHLFLFERVWVGGGGYLVIIKRSHCQHLMAWKWENHVQHNFHTIKPSLSTFFFLTAHLKWKSDFWFFVVFCFLVTVRWVSIWSPCVYIPPSLWLMLSFRCPYSRLISVSTLTQRYTGHHYPNCRLSFLSTLLSAVTPLSS